MTITQIQDSLIPYFRQKPVVRAWLFGSHVDGTARINSDVDILVELDYEKHLGLGFISMWLEIKELLGRDVDLITTRGISPLVAPYIESNKKLIYERLD
ncbi:MAG TPA: nucleotidyltransferase [Saprospirales bacterium]|nr:nucleotidyltransferase [Saprospirales bacterium]HRQ28802.1 nucleotidyltransferase domain-containing protein [Saprospiraceae bacterium]